MDKYGTGATEAIWGWWNDFWTKNVKDKGIGGMLAGIFPFIITIIGVVIMGIVDTIVAFFKWFGGLFNGVKDDNARELINRLSCAGINGLTDDRMVELINDMLDGPTGDDDENAILKLLGCLNCDRLRTIVNRVGRDRLESDLDGSEYDRLRVLLGNCGIISMADWDDDATRIFVNGANCETLNGLTDQRLVQLINNMLEGATLDEDENAILKLLRCLSCERMTSVVSLVGRNRLESSIDGSEYDKLRVLLGNCGIISMSSWDDDATRVFINSTNCEALNALSLNNIKALINNMFEGSTGDDDEKAIIKLIECLSPEKVGQLLASPGFSKSDFDDEVDGSEWTKLKQVFQSKGF